MPELNMIQDNPYKYNRSEANVLAAKNLFPLSLAKMIDLNTDGTWNGNAYTRRGITYTVNDDLTVTVSGSNTSGSTSTFNLCRYDIPIGSYKVNGVPEGASSSGYYMSVRTDASAEVIVLADGVTLTSEQGQTDKPARINVLSGTSITESIMFKPMLRYASDPDGGYQMPAKTNRQLTTDKCENSVIAPTENGATASRAYNLGKPFIRDGAFCIAKSAIAQGESFTLNTNYIVQNLGDEASVNNADIQLPSSNARQMITMPEGYTSATNGSWYLKKGSKVCVCMQLNKNDNTAIGDSWVDIMTMPSGYRPQSNIYFKVCGNIETKNAVARVSASDNKLQIISEDKGLYGYFEYEAFR